MDFGAHLPLIDFDGDDYSLAALQAFTESSRDNGFEILGANDHLLFSRPWLDGLAALAAVLPFSGRMGLLTSVALPVIRGPAATAKTLAAIDIMSTGRLIAGVGPGSSRADYEAAGLDFEERWKRLDEAVPALRALWQRAPFKGNFYSTEGVDLLPEPARPGGPSIWIGSWGSTAGLRRVARLGDGWIASAYNTSPADFGAGRASLGDYLKRAGREHSGFPNCLATMWSFVTESRPEAEKVLERLAAVTNREPESLASRLAIGSAEHCAAILRAYRDAGAQRVLFWPLADGAHQLEILASRVRPLVED